MHMQLNWTQANLTQSWSSITFRRTTIKALNHFFFVILVMGASSISCDTCRHGDGGTEQINHREVSGREPPPGRHVQQAVCYTECTFLVVLTFASSYSTTTAVPSMLARSSNRSFFLGGETKPKVVAYCEERVYMPCPRGIHWKWWWRPLCPCGLVPLCLFCLDRPVSHGKFKYMTTTLNKAIVKRWRTKSQVSNMIR